MNAENKNGTDKSGNVAAKTPPTGVQETQDEMLFRILDEYTARFPDGNFPDRATIREEYPEMADQVWECLEGLAIMRGVAETPDGSLSGTASVIPGLSLLHDLETRGGRSRGGAAAMHADAESSEKMALPQPLGDFQLLREIGRGGMGVVYEARQCSLGRRVALKILPFASTVDPRQLQRFQNEAAAAAHLEHPGIVPIYAVGCERGVHFYAMRLINGQHLGVIIQDLRQHSGIHEPGEENSAATVKDPPSRFLNRNTPQTRDKSQPKDASKVVPGETPDETRDYTPVPSTQRGGDLITQVSRLYSDNRRSFYRTVAQYMRQAAEALDYAHQCGVIHRDIKPANLLVDTYGKLWITDFGLAHIQSNVQLTQTGEIFGTPRYMSPEQAQGQNRLADHRVDVYSLGATFYELLTLHPIFPEKNQVRLLQRISHEEPRPPREYDAHIPQDLETILLKCISKTPQERYETAGELAADLQRFLEDMPIRAKRPGMVEITRKWLRRHPSIIRTAVAMMAVMVFALLMNRHVLVASQQETHAALTEARARFAQARKAADTLINIAREDLGDDCSPAMRQTRQKLLYTALGLYQDFLTNDELDAETQLQLTAMSDYIQQFMQSMTELEGMPPIYLLNMRPVQSELMLTVQQREQVMKLGEEMRTGGEELFRETRSMPPDERLAMMVKKMRGGVTEVQKILTPEQFQRLIQIGMQARPDTFTDPQIARQLALTEAQQKKVQELLVLHSLDGERMMRRQLLATGPPDHGPRDFGPPGDGPRENGPFGNGPPGDPTELGWHMNRGQRPGPPPDFMLPPDGNRPPDLGPRPFSRNNAEMQKEMEAILTPEQLKIWQELRGEPFQNEPPALHPGGPFRTRGE